MPIEQAEFGRTGHQSSRVIFGGAALAEVSQRVADETLDVLLSYGVNHLDVASSYGEAEVRIRPWLQREPGRFFLATKGDERTAAGAREDVRRSLDRLGVNHVDLRALHALADPIEWDIALSPGGALEAAIEAREQGLIRWIGVTGHGSQIAATHRRSLDRFDFDSVLLPYNFVTMSNPYYAGQLRRPVRHLPRAPGRGADDQGDCAAPLGRPAAHPGHLVRATGAAGRHRPGGVVGAAPARGLPRQRGGRGPAPEGARRGQPVHHDTGRCRDERAGRADGGRATPSELAGTSPERRRQPACG